MGSSVMRHFVTTDEAFGETCPMVGGGVAFLCPIFILEKSEEIGISNADVCIKSL